MKKQSIRVTLMEITFDNGKSEIRAMTPAQIAGMKKSKERKSILAKRKLAAIEINIKLINQPL